MENLSPALQFLLLVFAGWVNRKQQDQIDYLREENRILLEQLGGKRLRLTDDPSKLSLAIYYRAETAGTPRTPLI